MSLVLSNPGNRAVLRDPGNKEIVIYPCIRAVIRDPGSREVIKGPGSGDPYFRAVQSNLFKIAVLNFPSLGQYSENLVSGQ